MASTKHSRHVYRSSTASGSAGSHVYSIYNKTSKPNVSAAAAAVQQQHDAYSPAPMPPAPPMRHSPPQARVSPPQAVDSPEQHSSDHNTPSINAPSRRSSAYGSSRPSQVTRAPLPPPPPTRNFRQPRGSLAQPHQILVKRSSSGSTSNRSRKSLKSNDPPGNALTIHQAASGEQALVRVDSVSHSSSQKSSKSTSKNSKAASDKPEMQLAHHIKAMRVIQEADEETEFSLSSDHYSETAQNYDKSLKSVCRRVEMMRLMNYFTAIHYRSRHFWCWFTPISSCIFLAGILSLVSAIDMSGNTTMILSLCTACFAMMAFVLNFLQSKHGWSSLAQAHRSASVELAEVGKKLDDLKEYEGALSSRSVSSRSRANAVRDVYRIDVYLTAMEKCTPDIPQRIDEAFRSLVKRMEHFGKKYPNAIKARLQDYDDEDFDPDDPIPLDMQLDAFDLLCRNVRNYSAFPMFLPPPQNTVGLTITSFFAKNGPPSSIRRRRSSYDSRSRDSRSSYSRRSSGDSYLSRSSYGSRSYDSYDSRSKGRRSGDSYTNDMYTEDSRVV